MYYPPKAYILVFYTLNFNVESVNLFLYRASSLYEIRAGIGRDFRQIMARKHFTQQAGKSRLMLYSSAVPASLSLHETDRTNGNRCYFLFARHEKEHNNKKGNEQKQNDCNGESCFTRTFGGIFIAAEKHVNKIGKKIKTSAKQEAA